MNPASIKVFAVDVNWRHAPSCEGMDPFEPLEQATRDVKLVLLPAAHTICIRDALYVLPMRLQRAFQAHADFVFRATWR